MLLGEGKKVVLILGSEQAMAEKSLSVFYSEDFTTENALPTAGKSLSLGQLHTPVEPYLFWTIVIG